MLIAALKDDEAQNRTISAPSNEPWMLLKCRPYSAICNCSSQLLCALLSRYATARHASRACCDLPLFRRSVIALGASAQCSSAARFTSRWACRELAAAA